MDDLGNWVYILLMVVVGISSVFSSINKKKRQQQTQMPDSDFPDLSFPEAPVPVPVPKEKSKKSPVQFPEQRIHQPLRSHATFPVTDNSVQTEVSIMSEKENRWIDELELTDAEAFRKAIIYSEIINRKY